MKIGCTGDYVYNAHKEWFYEIADEDVSILYASLSFGSRSEGIDGT